MFVTCRSVLLLGALFVVSVQFAFPPQPAAAQETVTSDAHEPSFVRSTRWTYGWLPPLRLRWVAPVSEAVSISEMVSDGRWFEHDENDEPKGEHMAPWAARTVEPTRLPCGFEPGGGADCRAAMTVVLVELP